MCALGGTGEVRDPSVRKASRKKGDPGLLKVCKVTAPLMKVNVVKIDLYEGGGKMIVDERAA